MKNDTKIMKYLNSPLMPDEEDLIEMNRWISESLRKEGFKRYEVSNYSRPGFKSKHNSAYWSMKPYIGFGPSACSFLNNTRWKNLPDTEMYIRNINSGNDIRRIREYTEEITRDMAETEILFTGLRTSSGIILEEFRKRCGKDLISGKRAGIVSELIDKGYAAVDSTRLRLTEKGMDMADGITTRLITVSE